ncbi:hypothetical protein [Pseudomonas sp.]|uniref:hypothetical protein n=1 Tax=Pseudomonas sp. TaxID=306 RepID=UPI0032639DA9
MADQLAEFQPRYKHGGQCLAEMQITLALSERERSLLAESLTRKETQLNQLTTNKQVFLQDNAVSISQLAKFSHLTCIRLIRWTNY